MKKIVAAIMILVLFITECNTKEEKKYYSIDGKTFTTIDDEIKHEKELNEMFSLELNLRKAEGKYNDYITTVIQHEYNNLINEIATGRSTNSISNTQHNINYLSGTKLDTIQAINGMIYYYNKASNEDFLEVDLLRSKFNSLLFLLDSLTNDVSKK